MDYQNLLYARDGGVAHVTLHRPDAANAIDLATARELMAVAIRVDEDPTVRAVLLDAGGKLFCAGGDVGSFRTAGDDVPALLKEITAYLHAAISRLARMRAPVVAAVHGAAAGAGFSLVCGMDLVLASPNAKFTMAYTQIGLAPDGSSSYWLPRLIGTRRTAELMLTNRRLSAEEARDWGIVNQIVPAEELGSQAMALARQLADGPTEAYGLVKKLLVESPTNGLETQMELESRAIAAAARSEDAREGMAAFFEKRTPSYRGR